MSETTSADISPIISRNSACEAFRDALHMFVGKGRRYSVRQLAKGAGIEQRMIECFMAQVESTEYRRPPIEAIFSITAFLRAEFTSEWLRKCDQGAYNFPEGSDDLIDELAEEADKLAASVRRARSPKSPGQTNIVPIEREAIKKQGRRVCSMARAVA